jgi:hypothetical protein
MKPNRICKNLRTKKMYVSALAAEAFVPSDDAPGNTSPCWCNCTLTEVGPDDRPVGPQACDSSRPCYEE